MNSVGNRFAVRQTATTIAVWLSTIVLVEIGIWQVKPPIIYNFKSTSMRKTTRTSRGLINFRLAFLAILSFWCCALSDTMPMNRNSRQGLESLQLTDNSAMKIVCDPPDSQSLLQILGPAFNARYMSLDEPPDEPNSAAMTTPSPNQNDAMFGIETDDTYSSRRRQMEPRGLKPLPFRVTSNHEQMSPDDGLYNLQVNPMQNISHIIGSRRRRSPSDECVVFSNKFCKLKKKLFFSVFGKV